MSPVPRKSLQMEWMSLSNAAGSALSYDARLIPSEVLECESTDLEVRIRRAAAMMFGMSGNEQAHQRMRPMGHCQGEDYALTLLDWRQTCVDEARTGAEGCGG